MKQSNWRKVLLALAFAASCMFVDAMISLTNQAHGETRGLAQPAVLEDRSVPILREISATLRQMDARLARLETTAQRLAAKSTMSPRRTTTIEQADEGTN